MVKKASPQRKALCKVSGPNQARRAAYLWRWPGVGIRAPRRCRGATSSGVLEPKWAEEVVHAGRAAQCVEAGPEWGRTASIFSNDLTQGVRA